MRKDISFNQIAREAFGDIIEETQVDEKADDKKAKPNPFLKAIDPVVDFLPGSMLASNPDMLKAVQDHVTKKIHSINKDINVKWNGTFATCRQDGEIVDVTEIHGATINQKTQGVSGVRVDLSRIKKQGRPKNG